MLAEFKGEDKQYDLVRVLDPMLLLGKPAGGANVGNQEIFELYGAKRRADRAAGRGRARRGRGVRGGPRRGGLSGARALMATMARPAARDRRGRGPRRGSGDGTRCALRAPAGVSPSSGGASAAAASSGSSLRFILNHSSADHTGLASPSLCCMGFARFTRSTRPKSSEPSMLSIASSASSSDSNSTKPKPRFESFA